eukprot:TRINITY_DN39856_c0_g1_i1.p1 TRINITY_DN39856_c0_g1~~TRINITY_DN39856_c0_g1_i1.p1  ORF type:complete len:739 (-),score=106.97 TRINITY_DN39856_c0_g1_i1:107-2281(-)
MASPSPQTVKPRLARSRTAAEAVSPGGRSNQGAVLGPKFAPTQARSPNAVERGNGLASVMALFRNDAVPSGRPPLACRQQRRRTIHDDHPHNPIVAACRRPFSPGNASHVRGTGEARKLLFDGGDARSPTTGQRVTAVQNGGQRDSGSLIGEIKSPVSGRSPKRLNSSKFSSLPSSSGCEGGNAVDVGSLLSVLKQVSREPALPGQIETSEDEEKGFSPQSQSGSRLMTNSTCLPRTVIRNSKVSLNCNDASQASSLLRQPADGVAASPRRQEAPLTELEGEAPCYGISSLLTRRRQKHRTSCPGVFNLGGWGPPEMSESSQCAQTARKFGHNDREHARVQPRVGRVAASLQGSPLERSGSQADLRRIIALAPGEKIFDLYFWDEVLQEQGHGGKVVSCKRKRKAAGSSDGSDNSPQDGCSDDCPTPYSVRTPFSLPTGSSKEEGGRGGELVMKIKAKKELRDIGAEAQFRKAQLRLLNLPPHDGVVPLHEVLEDETFYYVVMEKATGGSLFCSLMDEYTDGNMPANAVRKVMKEILEAVLHVHNQGMLHRDIKPDNLVVQVGLCPFAGKSIKKVKLIDFDVADPEWCPASPKRLAAYVGTLRYSAPESFLGHFSEKTDLYSIGTILYLIMTGNLPYPDGIFRPGVQEASLTEIFEGMRQTPVDWTSAVWEGQQQCMDFCKQMLAFEPKERMGSAAEALAHPWLDTEAQEAPSYGSEKTRRRSV